MKLFNSFLSLIVSLFENSKYYCSDFKRAPTVLTIMFDMTGLCTSLNRGNSVSNEVITNYPELFLRKLFTLVSSSGHCLLLLGPNLHSQCASHSFRQANRIQMWICNFTHNTTILLLWLKYIHASAGAIRRSSSRLPWNPFELIYTTHLCSRVKFGGVATFQCTAAEFTGLEKVQRAATLLVGRPRELLANGQTFTCFRGDLI